MTNKEIAWESWNNLLADGELIWIYGTGIVAKRLFDVFIEQGRTQQVSGFVVSQKNAKECGFYKEKPILSFDELLGQGINMNIWIAVSDVYQNEIELQLKESGITSIVNAYPYSFLLERNLPEDIFKPIPTEMNVDIRELMIQQFQEGKFKRYDVIKNVLEMKKGKMKVEDISIDNFLFTVDSQMQVVGNARELAYVIYNDIKYVKIRRDNNCSTECFDYEWLTNSLEDAKEVEREFEGVSAGWKIKFVGIIWPTAELFFDDILADLQKNTELVDYTELHMNKSQFKRFMDNVYDTDDAEAWKIDLKMDVIGNKDEYVVKVVQFYINNPMFRFKHQGHTISQSATKIKTEIRKKYRERIPNYVYDVIFHVADNYEQSDKLRVLIH